jgi:hypothetical protein
MLSCRCLRALIPFCLLIARLASAQSAPETPAADTVEFVYAANEPKRALKDGKVIRAVRVVMAPTIDGRLGDEVWTLAPIGQEYRRRPLDSAIGPRPGIGVGELQLRTRHRAVDSDRGCGR